MNIIVDANILFSVLIKGGYAFKIFVLNKKTKKFVFYAPEFIIIEARKYLNEIIRKMTVSESELEKIFNFLESELNLIPLEDFIDFYEQGTTISPDLKDVSYFSLALKLNGIIRSNDKKLKMQTTVKVVNTSEIFNML